MNYTKTVAEIFADVTRHFPNATGNVNFHCMAQDPQMRKQDSLPSWVPDFSARGELPLFQGKPARWKTTSKLYKLSQGLKELEEFSPSFFEVEDNLRILRVRVLALDTVAAIGETYEEIINGGMWERTIQLLFDSQRYAEPYAETLWRLIIAYTSSDGETVAPQEMARDFHAFVIVSMVMSMLHDPNHPDTSPNFKHLVDIDTARGAEAVLPTFDELREWANVAADRYRAIESGGAVPQSTPMSAHAILFTKAMEPMCYRRTFLTESGLVGIGPVSMQAGDTLSVLPEAPLPSVVRKLDGQKSLDDGIEARNILSSVNRTCTAT